MNAFDVFVIKGFTACKLVYFLLIRLETLLGPDMNPGKVHGWSESKRRVTDLIRLEFLKKSNLRNIKYFYSYSL